MGMTQKKLPIDAKTNKKNLALFTTMIKNILKEVI